jgi:hypothetical protein
MSYRFADSLRAGSGRNRFRPDPARKLYDIYHCSVYKEKKTPEDGQRNCTKNVELYPKNKFEKLLYLVSFIIRVYHDAQSTERQMWRYTVLKHQLQGPV